MSGQVEAVLARLGIGHAAPQRGWIYAPCPGHAPDAHPSWRIRVTPLRYGQHHCFSCHFGGTLADLVAHKRGVSLAAAREWIREAGGEAPPEPPPALRVRLLLAGPEPPFRRPAEVILEPLDRWVTPARRYAEARGLTAAQVERWQVGYAVDGRLAGRLVVPVLDAAGEWASYMARDFTGDPAARRYLYPRGADGPRREALFGEAFWPPVGQRGTLVVGEGALKVLAAERVAPVPVAALGGSGLSSAHAAKVATFPRVVILRDPGKAGDELAAALAAALARTAGHVACARFDPGEDADSVPPEVLRGRLAAAWPPGQPLP